MPSKPIRIYVDTSVFGGVFDKEFGEASGRFFEAVRAGDFIVVVSDIVRKEVVDAPDHVRRLFHEILPVAEIAQVSTEAVRLRAAYLAAGIVSPRSAEDAMHVALATIAGCAVIVSWNFKHIVHFQKIPLYNAVNTLRGLGPIRIHSPSEVSVDDDKDKGL